MAHVFNDSRDISVDLDGWDFNAYHGSTRWLLSLSGVKGLWDGRASNLSTSQLAMIDGLAWNVPRYGGKTVDLTGYILGNCPAGILDAWKNFKGVLGAADDVHSLAYRYADGQQYAADVLQATTAPTLELEGMTVGKFTVSLAMPSGRGLATDAQSVLVDYRGALAGGYRFPMVFNGLTFDDVQNPATNTLSVGGDGAEWSAVFRGPLSGPFGLALESSPDYWCFNTSLGPGDVLALESRDRSIELNGKKNAALVEVVSYAWWALAGDCRFRLLSSSWLDGGYALVSEWDYD